MCNTYWHSYQDYYDFRKSEDPSLSDEEIARDWDSVPDYNKAKEIRKLVVTGGKDRWRIRKTNYAPIIRLVDGKRDYVNARWGFDRTDHPYIGNNAVNNTRDDKLGRKGGMWGPSWRERRCLIPMSGFFEWRTDKVPGKKTPKKVPHAIRLPKGEVMIAAGVWEEHDDHGLCYSMLTTTPNAAMAKVHDRMPVLLAPDQRDEYLNAKAPPQELVLPYKGQLEIFECASPLTKDWKPGPPEPIEGQSR